MSETIFRALTIAGSDASGGAGMAADLTTFEEYGIYGQVALTTVVSMDAESWNHRVHELPEALVRDQLETILACDHPLTAIKTGMLGSPAIVRLVREIIDAQPGARTVIDPVLVCKGTDEVLNPDTADAIREHLLPAATVATPNLFEAGVMSGLGILKTIDDLKAACGAIHALGARYVVVKGGKALDGNDAIDVFYDGEQFEVLSEPKVPGANNHGAGCTFAAAVAAGLALGMDAREAVIKAKTYVTAAIRGGFAYNRFVGPVFRPSLRLTRQGRF